MMPRKCLVCKYFAVHSPDPTLKNPKGDCLKAIESGAPYQSVVKSGQKEACENFYKQGSILEMEHLEFLQSEF